MTSGTGGAELPVVDGAPSSARRLAVLSLHTSPLAQAGSGDGGGMNVYVRELVSSLAEAGVDCRVYVRRWEDDLPERVAVEPGFEVVHVPAGPPGMTKEELPEIVGPFTDWVAADLASFRPVAVHANYWLSGVVGAELKRRLGLPLVSTFHTLARVKADNGDPEPERRDRAEAAVMACSDVVLANCSPEARQLESLYHLDPARIEVVTPGVDHAFFSPGDPRGARWALDAGPEPLLLFVGRIQPLKGLDVAVRALAAVRRQDARLWVVGGASGQDGDRYLRTVVDLAHQLGVASRVRFIPPLPHHLLSTYYRAADVCLVPSRSESFGLVALEAAACGVPVVASAVGGLRTLIEHGRTGHLVEGRDPADYAAWIDLVLSDPVLHRRLSVSAAARARIYTWSTSAARLRRLYADLAVGSLVSCN